MLSRNRHFFNNLTPAAYGGHTKELMTAMKEMLTQRPPSFCGKLPKWYNRLKDNKDDISNPPVRLNIWARKFSIPEIEIPNFAIIPNVDGSYRFNPCFINQGLFKVLNVDDLITTAQNIIQMQDWMTTAGGEHCDYIRLSPKINQWKHEPDREYWMFYDDQKLNPQYTVSDICKDCGIMKENSIIQKFLDKHFFSKDIGMLIGAGKKLELKQGISYDKTIPIDEQEIMYFDPTKPIKSDADIQLHKG